MYSTKREVINLFAASKGDDSSVDKKMEADKRGMSDYNGEMRRGGRGGGYRMSGSKDMGSMDMGAYGDKVRVCKRLSGLQQDHFKQANFKKSNYSELFFFYLLALHPLNRFSLL